LTTFKDLVKLFGMQHMYQQLTSAKRITVLFGVRGGVLSDA